MKKFILLLLCFGILVEAKSQENFPISFGPQLGMKFGVNGVETPLGRKNGIALANLPDAGIHVYMPLTENYPLGISMDVRFSPYSFFIIEDATDKKYQHSFNYLVFNASLNFKGILFGFTFGSALNADAEGIAIKTDDLSTMSEVQIGYTYPIWADDTGRFNVFIKGSYFLNQMFNDFPKVDPMKNYIPELPEEPITNNSNPRAASVSVGFNYLFNLYPPVVPEEEEDY